MATGIRPAHLVKWGLVGFVVVMAVLVVVVAAQDPPRKLDRAVSRDLAACMNEAGLDVTVDGDRFVLTESAFATGMSDIAACFEEHFPDVAAGLDCKPLGDDAVACGVPVDR